MAEFCHLVFLFQIKNFIKSCIVHFWFKATVSVIGYLSDTLTTSLVMTLQGFAKIEIMLCEAITIVPKIFYVKISKKLIGFWRNSGPICDPMFLTYRKAALMPLPRGVKLGTFSVWRLLWRS